MASRRKWPFSRYPSHNVEELLNKIVDIVHGTDDLVDLSPDFPTNFPESIVYLQNYPSNQRVVDIANEKIRLLEDILREMRARIVQIRYTDKYRGHSNGD